MAAAEEARVLLARYGPPTPSLLPWAARWASRRELLLIARAALAQAELRPLARWPVVADAVAEVLARRRLPVALTAELADVLPPIAGYLRAAAIDALLRADPLPRTVVLGYAALADESRRGDLALRAGEPWARLLSAPTVEVPPLADSQLLLRLLTEPAGEPGDLLGAEVVYLLPFLPRGQRNAAWVGRAVDEIESGLPAAAGWYTAALCAHVVPFLGHDQLLRLRRALREVPPGWEDLLRGLVDRSQPRWRSAAAELAAAHPAMPALQDLSRGGSHAELAAAAGDIAARVFAEHGGPADESGDSVGPAEGALSPRPPARIIYLGEPEKMQLALSVPRILESLGQAPAAPPERHVNVAVGLADGDQPVTDGHLYQVGVRYELLASIGRPAAGSLLPAGESRWPGELLPPGGLWLQAALALPAGAAPVVRTIYLPEDGESFSCDCPFGGAHEPDCGRYRWARFPVPAAGAGETLPGELVIYYGAAAVIAIGIRLSPGEAVRTGTTAMLQGRLTSTFADLSLLEGRSASIVSVPGQDQLMVNGAAILENPRAIVPAAADGVVLNARDALFRVHFEETGEKLVSRLTPSFGKSQRDYEDDLRRLASLGAELFTGLFNSAGSDNEAAYALPALVRHEAQVRDRPPTLQILDQRFGDRAVPWALIYDQAVGSDTSGYVLCPSVKAFGPAAGEPGDPPVSCPYPHDDRDDVLCPYGFWGLSCVLEQPVLHSPAGRVVCGDQRQLSWLVITDPELTEDTVTSHLNRLRVSSAGAHVNQPSLGSTAQLVEALTPESMDVVYFYCHSGYVTGHPDAPTSRYLKLGAFSIQPLDVARWARGWYRAGLNPHWPSRRPLIILNGCHTAEYTSGTLNSFATSFVQSANAAGVVGTEITLEQGFAAWAGEELLGLLASGLSVGQALHRLRWNLLRRGNVLGLAYTPFCLANLTLRPIAKD
jgi:hypothetical protein